MNYINNNLLKHERMDKKGFTPEQIIDKFHEAMSLYQGLNTPIIIKKIGVNDHPHYHHLKEHGSMRAGQDRQLKELEHENSHLKKLVANLTIDNAILKEASR